MPFFYKFSKIVIKFICVLLCALERGSYEKQYFDIRDEPRTSDVIDLSTLRTGADVFMEYNDMVRDIKRHGIGYVKKNYQKYPLAKNLVNWGNEND